MRPRLTLPLIALGLVLGACASQSMPAANPPGIDIAKAEPITLSYEAGEVMSYVLITTKDTDESAAVRQTYYETAFPLADQYGLSRDLNLAIPQQIVGKYKADGMAIFSYPDASSVERLNATPEWPDVKALRPQAWDELAIFTQTLEQPLDITFNSDKIYTLAVAEITPGAPDDYNKYMAGIEPGLNEMGGRFIYRMINPSVEAHRHTYDPQVQVTMVEWDTAEALAGFTRSPAYKENSKYFTSGVSGFSFFQIAPRTPTSQ